MSEADKRQIIAARIREARRLAGLSQGQVAKILNLHRPSVSEIEAGNRKVSIEELQRLAEIFDVDVEYLIGDIKDKLDIADPKIRLAARELQKLPPDALDKLLQALAAFRSKPTDSSEN